MQNFIYQNPTRVHFGKGVIAELGPELAARGARRVLLVYGRESIFNNGVYDQVSATLKDYDIDLVEHGGVQGNPLLSHTRAGIQKGRAGGIDAVCAVGGGSVIDEAKAIAAGISHDRDIWELFSGTAQSRTVLPLFAVLTLPATGSEMNGICVITNEETDEKSALVIPSVLNPVASFLDPQTTFSLSAKQTAYACTDIISHVLEAYFTTPAESLPVQDRLLAGVAKGVVDAMAIIQKNPEDYAARAAFMWSSTMAWCGICQAGVPSPSMPNHALEMPMSAVYDIAHGAGLSVVIPAWTRLAGEKHEARVCRFVEEVFGEKVHNVEAAAETLKTYYQSIGSPVTFAEAGVPDPDIDKLTDLALRSFVQRKMTDYKEELIRSIYQGCL
ncbi:MAG: iron-containing alcohol dehydrogenase [Desulfuromonadales bacterium]|nr:iron-containing alcohol dehydrogenase [Desulfuromonadales bacterium]MBN2791463.1 iron-containing alcohol dehydrogenase [Desulfuromonadales bacterium]